MTSTGLILLTAGGTGGHIFPAEALAAELQQRGRALGLVTDRRGAGFGGALAALTRYPIDAGGIAGRSPGQRLAAMTALARGYWQARGLIRRLRPAAVVGFGGYASVPAVLAASHAGVPTVLHEQNAVLGRANRLLAPRVSAIATCYGRVGRLAPVWQPRVRQTGMPVRPAIIAQRLRPYPALGRDQPLSLLVLGGSQGARVFSELLPAALLALSDAQRLRLRVSQQCRPEDLALVRAAYAREAIDADLQSFFDDVPERLAAAHLVIARSGASTVAELAMLGRPGLLVPYPHAIDDHQTANARAFTDAGAGWLLPQAGLSALILGERLQSLFAAPAQLTAAAEAAAALAAPEAAARLADLVLAQCREARP